MKKTLLLITTLILSVFLTGNVVSADNGTTKKIGTTEIEILEDGSVAPVKNYEDLDEKDLNLILLQIGHSFKDIQNYTTDHKRLLVSYGGKRVELEIEDAEYSYVSGEDVYSEKDYGLDEIRNQQIDDLKAQNITDPKVIEERVLPKDSDISPMDNLRDCQTSNGNCAYGKFEGRLQAFKVGETSNQSQYIFQESWDWVQEPFVQGTDFAGIHWGAKGEPESGTAYGEGAYSWNNEFYNYFNIPIDVSSVYGITANVDFPVDDIGRYEHYMGSIMEVVNVNTNTNPPGTRATLSTVYAHPHTPNNWSIGVSAGGLSLSGNLGFGDRFTWRYSFTLQ